MDEKYVNYVNTADGRDLLDLRHDSIKPEHLLLGETAHDATGKPITGELVPEESNIVDSGQCGDSVYWNLYDNGVLYIYGEGDTYNYETGLFEEDNGVTDVIIKDGVTSIGTALLRKSDLVNVVIPNSVTDIMGGAFIECRNLEKITIPNGVIRIHSSAFENCEKLSSVTIPDSITDIRSYAFNGCDSLTDVLYNGTKEQWDLITIIAHNEPLLNATLYCEYKEEQEVIYPTITKNGEYEILPEEGKVISKAIVEVDVKDADTVDGWHIEVISDSTQPTTSKPTISYVYTLGG